MKDLPENLKHDIRMLLEKYNGQTLTLTDINMKNLLNALTPVYDWFCHSLGNLYDFPPGAQAAIAFLSIVAAIVIILKATKVL